MNVEWMEGVRRVQARCLAVNQKGVHVASGDWMSQQDGRETEGWVEETLSDSRDKRAQGPVAPRGIVATIEKSGRKKG